jgi:hypothetical protein
MTTGLNPCVTQHPTYEYMLESENGVLETQP